MKKIKLTKNDSLENLIKNAQHGDQIILCSNVEWLTCHYEWFAHPGGSLFIVNGNDLTTPITHYFLNENLLYRQVGKNKSWSIHPKGVLIQEENEEWTINGQPTTEKWYPGYMQDWIEEIDKREVYSGKNELCCYYGIQRKILYEGDFSRYNIHPNGVIVEKRIKEVNSRDMLKREIILIVAKP